MTSGVPQRLHVVDDFNSDHFQQVGQQTATATRHSCLRNACDPAPSGDGATPVTGSNQAGLHSTASVSVAGPGWLDPAELRVGLGCMRLSTAAGGAPDGAAATIKAALDAGITVFDTARAYGDGEHGLGENERLLASVLREHDPRRAARIVTKGGMTRSGGGWIPDGRAGTLIADCEASLAALDGIAIDLYLIHAPDQRLPWQTSLRALARLLAEGMVKRVGISNVNRRQLDEALEIVDVAAVEVALSVFDDSALRGGVVERCVERGVAVIAHSPLGGPRRASSVSKHPVLTQVAAATGTTPGEIALAWLLELAPNVLPIPGARRPATARSSADVARLRLSDADSAALTNAFGRLRRLPSTRAEVSQDADIVVIAGIPGAGKSRVAAQLAAAGYHRLNRDTRGGTLRDLLQPLDDALTSGVRRIVLDNTYLTRASRSHVIEVGELHGAPVRCIWIDTALAQAQVNIVERLLDRFGALPAPEELRAVARKEPGLLTPTSQMRALRDLEPPSTDEGFVRVDRVPFTREAAPLRRRVGGFVDANAVLQAGWRDAFAGSELSVPHLVFEWSPTGSNDRLAAAIERLSSIAAVVEGGLCPHAAGPPVCWCRPPLPGLLLAFARRHGVDPARSVVIGTGPSHRTLAATLGARYVPV
jgi:aryl-alcohol dehydrogenase-like predicted oxidoreductase/predicted kinase